MDLGKLKEHGKQLYKKYKYVLLILLIGLAFMLIPSRSKSSRAEIIQEPEVKTTQNLCQELGDLLGCIQGAGQVRVMLTVARGEETVYQQNESYTSSDNGSSDKQDTVVLADSNRNEVGLLRQINPPVYQGAVIVCQGADSAQVRLAIIDAVSKLTGLGANQISVVKMK